MALETLKGVTEIDGFNVVCMDDLREDFPEKFEDNGKMKKEFFEKEIRGNDYIVVNHEDNVIAFTLQNGPISENGVNGCQIDTILTTVGFIISELNNKFPCSYNERAMECIHGAINNLKDRKADRERRKVEGLNKE